MKKKLTKTAIKQNEIYKRNKQKDKIASKLEQKLLEQRQRIIEQYSSLRQNHIAKITKRYDDKLAKRLRREEIKYEKRKSRQIKVKVYKKEVKQVLPTLGKMKSKALTAIQRFCVLLETIRTDEGLKVYVYDKEMRVPLDRTVNWGHVYPKSNFANMMFDEANIYPITSRENKRQWDMKAEWRFNLPLVIQNYLEEQSKDKSQKWRLRSYNDYLEVYEKYKSLVEQEENRLQIEHKSL